ncbi:MAG TPA: D-cysteine desulfhydrase family protein [Holophaga sp.]|nr:D-cysteine desulfhydrase family protein [Holophaga sp.]
MPFPKRLPLACLPTPIAPLARLTKLLGGPELWIKRDDHTGVEMSGNKVRKLEFAIQEALDTGCDTLITCGGIQSNHARATAAAAAKLGLRCILVLNAKPDPSLQGNYLLDQWLNAEVRLIRPEDVPDRMKIMMGVREELAAKGRKGYILPVGASNGIGAMGYAAAMQEICDQEAALGFRFDAVVCAVGSGGTFAGLVLGQAHTGHPGTVYGIPICDDAAYFRPEVHGQLQEAMGVLGETYPIRAEDLHLLDGHAGRGYSLSRPEELETIRLVAHEEGVVLDPVYTGKAMHGLLAELRKGTFAGMKRILFIHTGGLFGVFHFLTGSGSGSGQVK